jgi:hypothetical protein
MADRQCSRPTARHAVLLWLVSALIMVTRVHGSWGDRDTAYRCAGTRSSPTLTRIPSRWAETDGAVDVQSVCGGVQGHRVCVHAGDGLDAAASVCVPKPCSVRLRGGACEDASLSALTNTDHTRHDFQATAT